MSWAARRRGQQVGDVQRAVCRRQCSWYVLSAKRSRWDESHPGIGGGEVRRWLGKSWWKGLGSRRLGVVCPVFSAVAHSRSWKPPTSPKRWIYPGRKTPSTRVFLLAGKAEMKDEVAAAPQASHAALAGRNTRRQGASRFSGPGISSLELSIIAYACSGHDRRRSPMDRSLDGDGRL